MKKTPYDVLRSIFLSLVSNETKLPIHPNDDITGHNTLFSGFDFLIKFQDCKVFVYTSSFAAPDEFLFRVSAERGGICISEIPRYYTGSGVQWDAAVHFFSNTIRDHIREHLKAA